MAGAGEQKGAVRVRGRNGAILGLGAVLVVAIVVVTLIALGSQSDEPVTDALTTETSTTAATTTTTLPPDTTTTTLPPDTTTTTLPPDTTTTAVPPSGEWKAPDTSNFVPSGLTIDRIPSEFSFVENQMTADLERSGVFHVFESPDDRTLSIGRTRDPAPSSGTGTEVTIDGRVFITEARTDRGQARIEEAVNDGTVDIVVVSRGWTDLDTLLEIAVGVTYDLDSDLP